jgi:hypothetical protein
MWEGGLQAQLDAVDVAGEVVVRADQYVTSGTAELVLSWAGSK